MTNIIILTHGNKLKGPNVSLTLGKARFLQNKSIGLLILLVVTSHILSLATFHLL